MNEALSGTRCDRAPYEILNKVKVCYVIKFRNLT